MHCIGMQNCLVTGSNCSPGKGKSTLYRSYAFYLNTAKAPALGFREVLRVYGHWNYRAVLILSCVALSPLLDYVERVSTK